MHVTNKNEKGSPGWGPEMGCYFSPGQLAAAASAALAGSNRVWRGNMLSPSGIRQRSALWWRSKGCGRSEDLGGQTLCIKPLGPLPQNLCVCSLWKAFKLYI